MVMNVITISFITNELLLTKVDVHLDFMFLVVLTFFLNDFTLINLMLFFLIDQFSFVLYQPQLFLEFIVLSHHLLHVL